MCHGRERFKMHAYNTEVRREILGVFGVNVVVVSIRIEKTIDQLDY